MYPKVEIQPEIKDRDRGITKIVLSFTVDDNGPVRPVMLYYGKPRLTSRDGEVVRESHPLTTEEAVKKAAYRAIDGAVGVDEWLQLALSLVEVKNG